MAMKVGAIVQSALGQPMDGILVELSKVTEAWVANDYSKRKSSEAKQI